MKEGCNGERNGCCLFDGRYQAYGQERMAAKRKEVVRHLDILHAKNLLPDTLHLSFQKRIRERLACG